MVYARSFLFEFKYSHKVAYVVEFSHYKIRLFAKNQIVNEGGIEDNIYSKTDEESIQSDFPEIVIDSPYGFDDLWDEEEKCCLLQTIQHSDVLYVFSENHPIMTLKRYSNVDWRLEELEIIGGPFEAMNTTENMITASDLEGEIELSSVEALFSEKDVGRLFRLRNYGDDETNIWVSGESFNVGDICLSDNKYYEALNIGESGSIKPVHTIGVKSDGGVRWKYVGDGNGVVKIIEFVDECKVKAKVLSRLSACVQKGTVYWEKGLLFNGFKHPKSGAFFRNRFCFLLNTETGPYVCLSKSGDYNNFSDMEYGEANAECAISVPVLNTEFNEAKWIYAKDSLFVGTGSGEFYIDVMTSSQALSQDNVKIVQISNVGSKGIKPVSVGSHVFFVDRYGGSLRELTYDYYNEGYVESDISILGKHLFRSGIVDIKYQEVSDKILWCLTNDGTMVAMTFSAEHEVAAFSRHDLSGEVESLAVIPDLEECRDVVWVVVKRLVIDEVVRCVEKMEAGMPLEIIESMKVNQSFEERNSVEKEYVRMNSWYLDGAVCFVRKVGDESEEILGLEHLEGMMVKIFADGGQEDSQLVVGGKVKIKKKWAKVLVGLPVYSQFIPQNIYIPTQDGSGIGQRQRINHVLLELYMSGGGAIGPNENELRDIYYRDSDAVMNRVTELFSGHKEVLFNGATNMNKKGASILIENSSVFPMNVLAIVPYIDVN